MQFKSIACEKHCRQPDLSVRGRIFTETTENNPCLEAKSRRVGQENPQLRAKNKRFISALSRYFTWNAT